MNLIPMPKILKKESGSFLHNSVNVITEAEDSRIKNALLKLPLSSDGAPMEIHINGADGETYTLKIEEDKIVLTADGLKGAFYGIQTLRQLFMNKKIPCLYIEDKPDFGYRGFHQDITRGKIPKVKTLKKLVDDMAY
ncbi:MAG: glycoside hydrolase family 20 zincin-like fold domain-containing protein [Monoglobaceae bacterium]